MSGHSIMLLIAIDWALSILPFRCYIKYPIVFQSILVYIRWTTNCIVFASSNIKWQIMWQSERRWCQLSYPIAVFSACFSASCPFGCWVTIELLSSVFHPFVISRDPSGFSVETSVSAFVSSPFILAHSVEVKEDVTYALSQLLILGYRTHYRIATPAISAYTPALK